MPRPRVSDEINRTIDFSWATEVSWATRDQRKSKVVNAWRAMHGNVKRDPRKGTEKVSRRHFEKRVRKTEQDRGAAPDENLVPASEPWHPWVNFEDTAGDTAFLLQIQEISLAELGSGFYELEAKWARRLRSAVQGFHPFGQYRLVIAYTMREMIGNYLRQAPWTRDLDSFIAYKPWLPGNHHAYELAVASGIAPIMKLDFPNRLSGLPLPEPNNLREKVRLTWAPQALWWFTPWGTHIPGRENDPVGADMVDLLLKSWAGKKLKLRRRYQRQQSVLKRQARNRKQDLRRQEAKQAKEHFASTNPPMSTPSVDTEEEGTP
jgi:hypothetical protein